MKNRPSTTLALAVAALLAACSSDPGPVAPETRLAGAYEATTWTMASDIGTFDLLASGSYLTLELRVDGTTAGTFHTEADAAPGVTDRTVDLAGTWSLGTGDVVTFAMDGDTYVRFVDWQYGAGRLESEFSIGGWTTATILRRE
jgi:hypothetical protein